MNNFISDERIVKIIINKIITSLIWLSFLLSTNDMLSIGLIASIFFAFIESSWKLYNEKRFYTTLDQFSINILILPCSLYYYNYYITFYFNIILFPLFLWIIEILSHIGLITMIGSNNAWYYDGKYCYFDNSICLRYIFGWWFLGICNYYIYPILNHYKLLFK